MIILLTRMQVFLINRVLRVVPFPPPPLSLLKRQLYSTQRRIQDFFQEGVHLSLIYFNTNKPHSSFFFFLQNTSCIRKPQVRGGVHTPCALPLDPPWYSTCRLTCCYSKTQYDVDQPVYGLLLYQWNVPFPGSGTFIVAPWKNSWSFASITPVFS